MSEDEGLKEIEELNEFIRSTFRSALGLAPVPLRQRIVGVRQILSGFRLGGNNPREKIDVSSAVKDIGNNMRKNIEDFRTNRPRVFQQPTPQNNQDNSQSQIQDQRELDQNQQNIPPQLKKKRTQFGDLCIGND